MADRAPGSWEMILGSWMGVSMQEETTIPCIACVGEYPHAGLARDYSKQNRDHSAGSFVQTNLIPLTYRTLLPQKRLHVSVRAILISS